MRWIAAGIQLHNGDDQTADWIAKAGTPETRARVRRWSRVETTGVYAAIGDDTTTYELRVSTEPPGGIVLRRKVYRDGGDPDRHTGEAVRFRHNTLDPDDLDDVLFDGWGDRAQGARL